MQRLLIAVDIDSRQCAGGICADISDRGQRRRAIGSLHAHAATYGVGGLARPRIIAFIHANSSLNLRKQWESWSCDLSGHVLNP